MANTDLALSPCETQSQSQSQSHSPAGRCGPSPKPSHFLTGVYSSASVPGPVSGPVPVAGPSPVSVAAASSRQAHSQSPATALEQYRLQLYNYALNIERLRCPQYGSASASATASGWLHPYSPLHCAGSGVGGSRLAISLFPQSQRIFQPEEPKPQHSYIGLIAMAILSSAEIKLVLSDIYQYILDNYPYFRTRGPGWRNSIRHNLSLNDCFIKSGRSANGKGHYWAIHPANMDDFRKGDFRRRKAQRKVRKHMGLSVDDASTDSPSPPPLDLTTPPPPLGTAQASLQLAALNYPYHQHYIGQFFGRSLPTATATTTATATALQQRPAESQMEPIYPQYPQHHPHYQQQQHHHHHHQHIAYINSTTTTTIANLYSQTRKRQFDVASLLAPDVQIVDIVADEAKTQHTLITKVQVQKHELELVVEQSRSRERDETEADIDVDGDGDGERDGERDGDSDREADDARRLSFDAEHNGSASASASISPVPSSSQHDSNSLEECPTAQATVDTQLTTTSTTLPLAMSMPKSYDPHLLSRYYGSYMAAAARRASIEANRVVQANKSMTTPPPKELLPNKL